jgi:CHASE3 domain sensor protein|tara:strand:+ start:397 stop:588 length:192 start_codon:yes stop_codon:yes gene_type:complete
MMEFLWSSLSFVCGVAFTLGMIELFYTMRENSRWEREIIERQKARVAEEDDPVRKKVILDRYV